MNFPVVAEVQVPKTAAVAELKKAVEDVFSRQPKDKKVNISWYVEVIYSLIIEMFLNYISYVYMYMCTYIFL